MTSLHSGTFDVVVYDTGEIVLEEATYEEALQFIEDHSGTLVFQDGKGAFYANFPKEVYPPAGGIIYSPDWKRRFSTVTRFAARFPQRAPKFNYIDYAIHITYIDEDVVDRMFQELKVLLDEVGGKVWGKLFDPETGYSYMVTAPAGMAKQIRSTLSYSLSRQGFEFDDADLIVEKA